MARGEPLRITWDKAMRRAVPAMTYAVACRLASYGDEHGADIFPGERRLAHDLSVSVATVRRHLLWLREAGWITRVASGGAGVGRPHEADQYQLTIPDHRSPVSGGHRSEVSGAQEEPPLTSERWSGGSTAHQRTQAPLTGEQKHRSPVSAHQTSDQTSDQTTPQRSASLRAGGDAHASAREAPPTTERSPARAAALAAVPKPKQRTATPVVGPDTAGRLMRLVGDGTEGGGVEPVSLFAILLERALDVDSFTAADVEPAVRERYGYKLARLSELYRARDPYPDYLADGLAQLVERGYLSEVGGRYAATDALLPGERLIVALAKPGRRAHTVTVLPAEARAAVDSAARRRLDAAADEAMDRQRREDASAMQRAQAGLPPYPDRTDEPPRRTKLPRSTDTACPGCGERMNPGGSRWWSHKPPSGLCGNYSHAENQHRCKDWRAAQAKRDKWCAEHCRDCGDDGKTPAGKRCDHPLVKGMGSPKAVNVRDESLR